MKKEKKDNVLILRLTHTHKKILHKIAKEQKTTLTDLVLSSIKTSYPSFFSSDNSNSN